MCQRLPIFRDAIHSSACEFDQWLLEIYTRYIEISCEVSDVALEFSLLIRFHFISSLFVFCIQMSLNISSIVAVYTESPFGVFSIFLHADLLLLRVIFRISITMTYSTVSGSHEQSYSSCDTFACVVCANALYLWK